MTDKKTIEKETETRVVMFDPTYEAYREIPLSKAVKFIEEAEKLKKDLIDKGLIEK